MKSYPVFKGLQKPLTYKGFKGKFIYWGIGCLLGGLILGALTMTMINMFFGVLVLAGTIVGGLFYTAGKQKKGLYTKTTSTGYYIYQAQFKNRSHHVKQ
jgi:hypothetical protein